MKKLLLCAPLALAACSTSEQAPAETRPVEVGTTEITEMDEMRLETATFGAGCYWCVEAVLEQLEGVFDVTSGFMGGHVDDPSYEAVCSGTTGHAEVVQVRFDPEVIAYTELLEWFLAQAGGQIGLPEVEAGIVSIG